MEIGLLSILGIGFLLGFRHALDPDHIVAVSTIASRTGNLFKASLAGMWWGIGHSLTLLIIGTTLVGMKTTIPETLSLSLEMVVAIMLIILGWTTFVSFKNRQSHSQTEQIHDSNTGVSDEVHMKKPNIKSLIVGMVHGLAGSGALVLLTMSSMDTMGEAFIYILVFGIGTILSMVVFAVFVGAPFIYLAKHASMLEKRLGMVAGIFSIVFGLFFMYEIAFLGGLFS